jgi:hypothetical protein
MGHSLSSIGLSGTSVADAMFRGKPELSGAFIPARAYKKSPGMPGLAITSATRAHHV